MVAFLIKLGSSVGLLLLYLIGLWLGQKISQSLLNQSVLRAFVLQVSFMLVMFVSLWLLTRLFPAPLLLVLGGAMILGIVIQNFLGSVTGITLPETKEKILALSVIWGAHQPFWAMIYGAASTLAIVISPIAAIVFFWLYPIGDPTAVVWITFFLFVFPALLSLPTAIPVTWMTVASPYLDDDVRNSHLISGFSSIFYRSVYLLFPFWLVSSVFPEVFGISIPPYWVLLTLPISVFVFGYLVPFYIGVYKFRSQSELQGQWRKGILQEMLEATKLALDSELRGQRLDEIGDKLSRELNWQSESNELLQFYLSMESSAEPVYEPEAALIAPPDDTGTADQVIEGQANELVAPNPGSEGGDVRQRIQETRSLLLGAAGTGQQTFVTDGSDMEDQVHAIIQANREKLVEWDLRFQHLKKMIDLREIVEEARKADVTEYIEARLAKFANTEKQSRNVLAGVALTVLSGVSIFVFNVFEDVIIDAMRMVIGIA